MAREVGKAVNGLLSRAPQAREDFPSELRAVGTDLGHLADQTRGFTGGVEDAVLRRDLEVTAVAGAGIGPAVAGITLGMFRQSGFNRQNGFNQAYNHAGNAVGAGLSGLLGWKFGLPAVFWLAVAFGIASIFSVLRIPADSIDDREARGMGPE